MAMRFQQFRGCRRLGLAFCAIAVLASTGSGEPQREARLDAAQVVARHLSSVGSPEAIAAVASRTVAGTGTVVSRLGGYGRANGPAAVVSAGKRTRIEFAFHSNEYPGELFVCNGDAVGTVTYQPGARSVVSAFVKRFSEMMREGLLGGTLTTAWALHDVPGRTPKLHYNGLKKIDGQWLHELRYVPKKGSDLAILLHFEPESFRHVRTQYRAVQPAGMASAPTRSSEMHDARITLVETFGDFREVDGLTLPQAYRFAFSVDGQSASFLADWSLAVDQVVNNAKLDTDEFTVP
jgi:hypothetical protein